MPLPEQSVKHAGIAPSVHACSEIAKVGLPGLTWRTMCTLIKHPSCWTAVSLPAISDHGQSATFYKEKTYQMVFGKLKNAGNFQ